MKIPNTIPVRSSLAFKASIVLSAIFLMEAVYLGSLAILVENAKTQVLKEREARQVLLSLSVGFGSTQNLLIGLLEHISAGKGKSRLDNYLAALANLPNQIQLFDNLKLDNPRDQKLVDDVKEGTRELPQLTEAIRNSHKTGGWKDTSAGIVQLDSVYHELAPSVEELERRYHRIDQDVSLALNEQSRMLINLAMFVGFGINAVMALLLYFTVASGLAKRLNEVSDDMLRVASGKQLPQRDFGDDEIDHLSMSLRSMATKIESFRAKEKTRLQNTPSFICALNFSAVIVEVGEGSSALWGYASNELLGRKLSTFLVDDGNLSADKIIAMFATGSTVAFENIVKRKDGSKVELSWRCRISQDKLTAICVAQDITARNANLRLVRQRQEDFRGIIDGMPLAVVGCDSSFTITSFNPSTNTLFRFDPAELLGKNLSLLLTGSQLAPKAAIKQLEGIISLAEKQPVELNAWRSDGTQAPVELNTRRYALADTTTYLATFRDVSTRVEIERVKRDFVAMLSHDLRSPLTTLHGTLELIVAEAESKARARDGEHVSPDDSLGRAGGIVQKLVHLMNDFLELEKFESGMGILDLESISAQDLIEKAIETLNSTEASRVVPTVSISETLKYNVDCSRMALALANLLATVNHNSAADESVEISAGEIDHGFEIKISTKFLKLPSTVKDALYSRYVLLVQDDSDSGSSSGIGLALAHAVVQAHGGTLTIEQLGSKDVIRLQLLRTAVQS